MYNCLCFFIIRILEILLYIFLLKKYTKALHRTVHILLWADTVL